MKTYRHLRTLTALVLLLGGLASCTSVEQLVDNGDYEATIRLAQRRLTGKQKKNPKYVAALETAVNRATVRDVELADRLKASADPDWARIHAIYAKMDRRQRALQPLLPLTDKRGYRAEFRFARVGPLLAEAAREAAARYYATGRRELALARSGDKAAGRAAYAAFGEVAEYVRDYRDAAELRREARELGKVFVAVSVVNESGGYLPAGFERELLRMPSRGMDSQWRFYDFRRQPGKIYDYDAGIVIRDIRVSPERLRERTYADEKEITDGTEYVLDANGNVAKDSLGNDITQPRRIIVRAEVLEVLQTKSAVVTGSFVLTDNATGRVVDEEALTAEAIFEHYASTYRGDRRALSSASRRRIGNEPLPFPSNEALILDAADVLKPQLRERLADSYAAR